MQHLPWWSIIYWYLWTSYSDENEDFEWKSLILRGQQPISSVANCHQNLFWFHVFIVNSCTRTRIVYFISLGYISKIRAWLYYVLFEECTKMWTLRCFQRFSKLWSIELVYDPQEPCDLFSVHTVFF